MLWHKGLFETRFVVIALLTASALLGGSSPSMGQAELAVFQGTVRSVEGEPLADAQITLKDVSRGGEYKTETNDKGYFYRRGLRPSEYVITIEKEGYEPFQQEVRFRAGEEKRQDFQLMPAASPAEAAFQEAVTAFNAGNYEEAARAFEEVVRLSPEAPEGHSNLGLSYMQLGRMEDAIRELEKAGELAPDSFRTWAQLGMVYSQAERFEDAIRAFETALAAEHQPADPMVAEASMALGSLYFAESRVEDAVAAYQRVLAILPDSPEALLNLGKCYFNLGDVEHAREAFNRIVEVAPDSPEAEQAKTFIAELDKSP